MPVTEQDELSAIQACWEGPSIQAPNAGPPPAGEETRLTWDFTNKRDLLLALVGYDFGPEPETKLDEIRAYKKNDSRSFIDNLRITRRDSVLDLGSGCGFLARVVAPLCQRIYCLDISSEFLKFAQDELRDFSNVEFHRIDYGNLHCLDGKRITKGYANAVFIHFNFFDIVVYLREIWRILAEGGQFLFQMSNTDCLDIHTDKHFGAVFENYVNNRTDPCLMQWNSAYGVCAIARQLGFQATTRWAGQGSAYILLHKPHEGVARGETETTPLLTRARGQAPASPARMQGQIQGMEAMVSATGSARQSSGLATSQPQPSEVLSGAQPPNVSLDEGLVLETLNLHATAIDTALRRLLALEAKVGSLGVNSSAAPTQAHNPADSWSRPGGFFQCLLQKPTPFFHIIDVGALGGERETYRPLLRAGRGRVVGFEPIAEECQALNRKFGPQNVYFPYVIGDGTRRRFHRCNFAMTSSLYEPDLEYMGRYHNLPHVSQVEDTWETPTVRLDDVKEAVGADFLKLDVQGAELDVLKGAEQVLESVVAIQTEVEFVPIYRGQPLFAEVDQFLRRHGFMFHRFLKLTGRALQSVDAKHDTDAERRQVLWSDAVYVRDISTWNHLSDESVLKLAVILHELYGSFDSSATLLQIYDQKTGSALWKDYLNALDITPGSQRVQP